MDKTDIQVNKEIKELWEINKLEDLAKKIYSVACEDFGKSCAIGSAVVAIMVLVIKSLGYCYKLGAFSEYGIDRCYINVSEENFILQVIQIAAVAILWLLNNYIYFYLTVKKDDSRLQWKRRLEKLAYILLQIVIMMGIIIIGEGITIEALVNEMKVMSVGEWKSFIILQILLEVMMNLLGILQARLYKKYVKKKRTKRKRAKKIKGEKRGKKQKDEQKKRIDDQNIKENPSDENKEEEDGRWRQSFSTIIILILAFSVELGFVYYMGKQNEQTRTEYKVVIEETVYSDQDYVFADQDGNTCIIYPIIYEDKDVYIVSRIYKKDGSVEIDNGYQRIIDKDNIETYRTQNLYSINIW